VRQKPESCLGCSLYAHGQDFSRVEGTGSSGLLAVAEASGEHEQRDELPLRPYAPSGSVFERILKRMGIDRQMLSVTNCIRCRPRGNFLENAPWEYSALRHCRPNLDQVIAERKPRAILALGGVATRELTGLAGEALGVSHLAGYVLPGPNDTPTVPVFHPAFLRRGKASHQGVFARILQRAVNIAAGKDREWMWGVDPEDSTTWGGLKYATHPSLEEAEAFLAYCLANPGLPISYDIETSESKSMDEDAREGFTSTHIELVQFAIEGRGAIALPWDSFDDDLNFVQSPFKQVVQKILHSPNLKCGHNVWLFDNKVLRAAGEREGLDLQPRGVIHDTLQMFHHWQPDLPAHLQFCASFVQFPFPWKHLASANIEFYGCCDVDATLRLYNLLGATLKRDGLWGDETIGYLGQVAEVRPVLAAMEDRGMPIDDAARLRLGARFEAAQADLGAEIAKLAPAECCRVHPKDGYKGVPPEVKKWGIEHPLSETSKVEQTTFEEWEAHRYKLLTDTLFNDDETYHYELRDFDVPVVDAATGGPVIHKTLRWCRVYDFNPNSPPQILAYMGAKRHKRPKSREVDEEGNAKDSTEAKELERLAIRTDDSFYLKCRDYKGYTKMRGTYVDGFAPGPDRRVHTTFTFAPAIGQLSSRNPNQQNFPKLKPTRELADSMREMVAADDGCVLTEWDFKSCHVITLGFLAEDLNYMRLGRLDIHSFVAGHFLNLWDGFQAFSESDEQLLARFKWLKSDPARKLVRDDQAKHGILGIGNGLKAKGLYERYMESFPPRACVACDGVGKTLASGRTRRCLKCKGTGKQTGRQIAEEVLATAEKLFPKVFEFQERQRKEAHEKRELRTPFGFIRRFYEVYRWDAKRSDWGHGDQAEEAVAYRLANIAFGHIREKLKALHRAGLDSKYGLFNTVHDSFMFHFPESMLEEHAREIYPVLTSPSTVLKHPVIAPEGLVIGVEGSYGKNWRAMEPIKLPEANQTLISAQTPTVPASI
jgi:uracil-DNA glycosylase family 4